MKSGFLASPARFERAAFRLRGVARLFCGVMHNITKSEKSLYYGVFKETLFAQYHAILLISGSFENSN